MLLFLAGCLYIPASALTDRVAGDSGPADVDSAAPDTDSAADTAPGPTVDPCGSGRETGAALHFADVADTVTVDDADALDFGVKWTVELWVWYDGPRSDSGAGGVLVEKFQDRVEDKTFRLAADESSNGYAYVDGGAPADLGGSTVGAGQWEHLAFVANGATFSVYAGGVLEASQVWTGDASDGTGELHFGAVDRDGSEAINGYLGGIRISRSARYLDAVFSPEPYPSRDADTVGLWLLGEGTGDTVADSSGNNLTGRISGAEWAELPCR